MISNGGTVVFYHKFSEIARVNDFEVGIGIGIGPPCRRLSIRFAPFHFIAIQLPASLFYPVYLLLKINQMLRICVNSVNQYAVFS